MNFNKIFISLLPFFLAGICEIGGGYLVWLWIRPKSEPGQRKAAREARAMQQKNDRIYAAYGGIFIAMALLWGWIFDGIVPDSFDLIGSIIAIIGVAIIFYAPRKGEQAIWSK